MIAAVRPPITGRLSLVAAIACSVLLLAACGGKAAVKPPPMTPRAYQVAIDAWSQSYHDSGIPILDRDYAFCLGPNDPIPPPSTPDPSGHTRARIPCGQAIQNIEPRVPDYAKMIDQLKGLSQGAVDQRIINAESAYVAWHSATLQLYQDAVAALQRGDQQAMSDLRLRYNNIDALQTAAIQAGAALNPTQQP